MRVWKFVSRERCISLFVVFYLELILLLIVVLYV